MASQKEISPVDSEETLALSPSAGIRSSSHQQNQEAPDSQVDVSDSQMDLDQHGEVDQDHDDEGSDDSGPPCGVHLLSDGTFRGDASFLLDPTRMMILNAVGAVLAKKDAENAAKGKGYSKGSAEDGKGQGKEKSEAAASSTASPKSTPSKKKKTSKK